MKDLLFLPYKLGHKEVSLESGWCNFGIEFEGKFYVSPSIGTFNTWQGQALFCLKVLAELSSQKLCNRKLDR